MTPNWSSGWSGWSTRRSSSGGSTRRGRRSARRTSAGTGACPSPTAGASRALRSSPGFAIMFDSRQGGLVVTLAAIFPPTQPPERIGAVAAAADAAGLAQLWVWEDCFKESGIATATAMLATTSQVGIAIGLLPVPLRNVALTAMEIATMARLFPGRLTAGVGHGVLDWMSQVGARAESPMTLLREYTAALHALVHGETVTTHGRYVHLDDVALDWPPAVVPPLLVGGIIPGGISPDEVRTSVGHLRAGRAAAGRADAGPADVVVFISAPADGPAAAIAATVREYARAGATHVAVNTAESDADLARFAGFLAREVSPLVR